MQVGGFKDEEYGDPERHLNWPNIAALAVWLLSVGTLLTWRCEAGNVWRFKADAAARWLDLGAVGKLGGSSS